jgi:hypothetical protein
MQNGDEVELAVACPFCGAGIEQRCRMQDWRIRSEVVMIDAQSIHVKRVQALDASIDRVAQSVIEDEDARAEPRRGTVTLTVPGVNGRWRVKASMRLGENTLGRADLLFKHVSWQRHWLDAWDRARAGCRALGIKEIHLEEWHGAERGWTLDTFEKNAIELRNRLERHAK